MAWEVVDDYGKVWFRSRTLRACGIWIDPIFGINFTGRDQVIDWDDTDRVTHNDDGSYTVAMYEDMGTLTVRKEVRS